MNFISRIIVSYQTLNLARKYHELGVRSALASGECFDLCCEGAALAQASWDQLKRDLDFVAARIRTERIRPTLKILEARVTKELV